MFYGSNVWDPGLIVAQIVSVQCAFYVTLGLIQAVTLGPTLGHITVAYIFDWTKLAWGSRLGLLAWASHVGNAVAGAGLLAWIVERAKKCLDFGATCYLWHTLFVWWYSGWPRSLAWWSANGAGLLVMVLLGEWLCVRRELQDIPLSIPQRLGSSLLGGGRRKESGAVAGVPPMMPLATDDPDAPPRPRLRTGLGGVSARAAVAAAAGSSTSFSSSSGSAAAAAAAAAAGASASVSPAPPLASPAQLPPGVLRPGGAVQMTPLLVSSAGGGGGGGARTPPRPDGALLTPSGAGGVLGAARKKLAVQVRPANSNSSSNLAAAAAGSGGGGGSSSKPAGAAAAAEALPV